MKTIGILGGMGPEASHLLYGKILALTPQYVSHSIEKDQDHIPVILYSNTQIPDRTESILAKQFDHIIPSLQHTAIALEKAGADFIVIPCNTAHFFYDDIVGVVDIPVVHIIRETAAYIKRMFEGVDGIGVLATEGSLGSGIFQTVLTSYHFRVCEPDHSFYSMMMSAVHLIKKGGDSQAAFDLLVPVLRFYRAQSISKIILGCTELSVLLNGSASFECLDPDLFLDDFVFIDPLEILAKQAIEIALG